MKTLSLKACGSIILWQLALYVNQSHSITVLADNFFLDMCLFTYGPTLQLTGMFTQNQEEDTYTHTVHCKNDHILLCLKCDVSPWQHISKLFSHYIHYTSYIHYIQITFTTWKIIFHIKIRYENIVMTLEGKFTCCYMSKTQGEQ